MSFSRVKSAGWSDDIDTLTAAQLNQFDVNQSRAIDGTGGGTYTPSVVIDIQGTAGLKISATGSAARLQYASRNVTRQFSMNANSSSGNWSRANTPRGSWQNTASGGTLDIMLEGLPNGNTLSSITLRWIGAAGHAAFPAGAPTMPSIELWKIDDDGTATSLGSHTDATATAGAYEAAHDITISSLTHTIDVVTYRYVLTVTGETGANFVANAKAINCKAVVAITDQTEW